MGRYGARGLTDYIGPLFIGTFLFTAAGIFPVTIFTLLFIRSLENSLILSAFFGGLVALFIGTWSVVAIEALRGKL